MDDREMVLVYRLDADPIEIPKEEILFVNHGRMNMTCQRERYLNYEYDETGVVGPGDEDDYNAIGLGFHAGADLALMGGDMKKCLKAASKEYLKNVKWSDKFLPEQVQILKNDSVHLVMGLVYAFKDFHLPMYLEQYKTLEVEEEINWLLKELSRPVVVGGQEKNYIVVMSRIDFVAEGLKDGELNHGSHKTPKRFTKGQTEEVTWDSQRFAEGWAIKAKYGRKVAKTLYNKAIKGDKRYDKETTLNRYVSGLIRPFVYLKSLGSPQPELISYVYDWEYYDESLKDVVKTHVGKGWERVNIYEHVDYLEYLSWLSQGLVLRKNSNYLGETIASMFEVEWDEFQARRWLLGAQVFEEEWANKVATLGKKGDLDSDEFSRRIPLAPSQCSRYTYRCPYTDVCWERISPDSLIEDGKMVHREPHHLQEF